MMDRHALIPARPALWASWQLRHRRRGAGGHLCGYQALQVLFPPNTYETALLATVADTVDADGVLLFDEVYVPGSGTLGYLAADGERVSAGAAVAEIYSSRSRRASASSSRA